MKLIVVILAAAVLALSVSTAYMWMRQTAALRTVLCLAERNTLTSKQRTPEEKRVIVEFYREALASINAKPCDPVEVAR